MVVIGRAEKFLVCSVMPLENGISRAFYSSPRLTRPPLTAINSAGQGG